MKKIILLLAAITIGYANANAQSCLPEGITFNNQEQIDNFQTNYPGCTEIEGNVTINGSNITNLNGLNILTSIGGFLKISGNDQLTSLNGLQNIQSISGDLSIGRVEGGGTIPGVWLVGNETLTDLSGLSALDSIGGDVFIGGNESLTSLTGLENLNYIGGNIEIACNPSLSSLSAFEGFSSLEGDLKIHNCYDDNTCAANLTLTNLTGLEYLTSIGGSLWIKCNNLASLTGLENLTSIGGDLDFGQNITLTSLTGLESLTSIGGDLSIAFTFALNNLTGLENLTSIGGSLVFGSNYALTSLTMLENLSTIGSNLIIVDNTVLTSLTGLDNIADSSITNLIIKYNSSLSTCEVQSICDYLVMPNGTVPIQNNAPGCNSPEEVIAECEVIGVEETIADKDFSISPNPFTGHLTIEFNLPQTSLVSIQIFNAMGAKVADVHHGQLPSGQQQFTLSAGDLPKGLYLCRVQAGNELVTRKILKH